MSGLSENSREGEGLDYNETSKDDSIPELGRGDRESYACWKGMLKIGWIWKPKKLSGGERSGPFQGKGVKQSKKIIFFFFAYLSVAWLLIFGYVSKYKYSNKYSNMPGIIIKT